MRPDLVLDDDDKRRRFKHSKIGGRKKCENRKVTSTHHKSNMKKMVFGNTSQHQPRPTKPPLAESLDTDEEDTEPRLLDPEEVDVERIYSELGDNNSCLDPETGLVLDPAITAAPLHTAGRAVNEGSQSFNSARRMPLLLGPSPGTVKLCEGSLTTLP